MAGKNSKPSPLGYMSMPAGFPYHSVFLQGRPQHEKSDDFRRRHPPMDLTRRAKIFAPFDALAGFSDAVSAKEILYRRRQILSEGEKETLDRKVSLLRTLTRNGKTARKSRAEITVQYFSPCMDPDSAAYGSGGTYETLTGICMKVNDVSRTITVGDTVLSVDDITDISSAIFDEFPLEE